VAGESLGMVYWVWCWVFSRRQREESKAEPEGWAEVAQEWKAKVREEEVQVRAWQVAPKAFVSQQGQDPSSPWA